MLVKLTDVRLSFPDLFKAKSVGDSEPRFSASFLLDKEKDAEQIAPSRSDEDRRRREMGRNIPEGREEVPARRLEKEYDGYTVDNMFISATNEAAADRG
jgi:hypothetical protein